jgi:LPS sulfotransferase NodH
MRLPRPFYRLPVQFDVARLQAEIAALPPEAWARHPNEIAGNSALRLITADGGENDDVHGRMQATPWLLRSPYILQVLASFGVVWGRSRLMRLAPGAEVPMHSDINYHWSTRVRLHIPVLTRPEVRFYCDAEDVHMAAGEAWVFDNWRQHRVTNHTPDERIHLVADTTGSAAFWNFVQSSQQPGLAAHRHAFDPAAHPLLMTERLVPPVVLPPAEVDLQLLDIRSELIAREGIADANARIATYGALLEGFSKDWRQLYLMHGESAEGRAAAATLRDNLRQASRQLGAGLVIRTNKVDAHVVLEGRVLRQLLPGEALGISAASTVAARAPAARRPRLLERPLFIVSAPRSGSTLLFETLASSNEVATLGGEAHWLVEGMPELRPGAPGVDSNRLVAAQATEAVASRIISQVLERAQQRDGSPADADAPLRFLEKTPKNALRIPFFDRIFPDARFIFLWRDPRENISSIMEAWRAGRWRTYRALDGFDGPWSLLLPPGWRELNGRPVEQIAARQWQAANDTVLDDLAALGRERWTSLSYESLLADPEGAVRTLCEFAGIAPDAGLLARIAGPLPHSRYTLTPPEAGKWRRNGEAIEQVLAAVTPTWDRLRALPAP